MTATRLWRVLAPRSNRGDRSGQARGEMGGVFGGGGGESERFKAGVLFGNTCEVQDRVSLRPDQNAFDATYQEGQRFFGGGNRGHVRTP